MEHRWTQLVITLFWLATMTWLTVEKILPPLRRGEPPSFHSVYANVEASTRPIVWSVTWNGSPMGWATTQATHPTAGMTEINSHVHFSRIPVEEMAPVWMRGVVHSAMAPLGEQIEMDAFNRMEIDPLNRLTAFRSSIRISSVPQEIVMQGSVDGSMLKLRVDAGELTYNTERYMPHDALIGDELSPQCQLPGLHAGQRWTVPVYNPLRPPDSPMEILQANVEGPESIIWNGESASALVVVYRSDSGAAFGSSSAARGKMWVDATGTVLRQEIDLLGSKLAFNRLPEGKLPQVFVESEASDSRSAFEEAMKEALKSARP